MDPKADGYTPKNTYNAVIRLSLKGLNEAEDMSARSEYLKFPTAQ